MSQRVEVDVDQKLIALRLQLGTYDGSVSRSEKGLPLVGLSDNGQRLRFLLRLAGKNESPVLVFKDTRGADRMVIGLRLADGSQEPFIATFDRNGKKQLLTGQYLKGRPPGCAQSGQMRNFFFEGRGSGKISHHRFRISLSPAMMRSRVTSGGGGSTAARRS